MDEFEFVKDLTAALNGDATESLARAVRNETSSLDVRARLRQEFTLAQRVALADMFRVVYAPTALIAGTGDRIADMLVGD